MDVKLARIDERLVHGQIITSWSKTLGITKILVIDDDVAKDPFMSQVITLSAQQGMNIVILEAKKATEVLQNDQTSTSTMLLFKNPKAILEMAEAGFVLPEINLGNLGSSPNRKRISKNVNLSPEEEEIVKKIIAFGSKIYLQMLPGDQKIDLSSVL